MNTSRLLAIGQATFFASIALCTAISPHFAKTGGGISNYGLYANTIPLFTLGFVASGGTAILAAVQLHSKRTLRSSLFTLGILMLAVLLSTYPYKVNGTLDTIHEVMSQALFVFEVWFGAWLAFRYRPEAWTKIFFLAQCISAILGLLTILGAFHLLFISQILTGLAFGALLLRATQRTV